MQLIRIRTSSTFKATEITVDGQLIVDYVEAVACCCRQAMSQGKAVHLLLRDVAHIDERGRTLLADLVAKSVHLSAAGIYSADVVAGVCRDASAATVVQSSGPATANANNRVDEDRTIA